MLSIVPEVARELGASLLGTFHIRQGDQRLLGETGLAPAGWVRLFGSEVDGESDQTVGGTTFQLAPRFDGDIQGFQAGVDLAAGRRDDGSANRVGLMFGRARARGQVFGHALAESGLHVGRLEMRVDSLGLYATHIGGDSAWYVDLVLMRNELTADGRSSLGLRSGTEGSSNLASIEAGRRFRLSDRWKVEPQAQFVAERARFDDTADRYSSVEYERSATFRGRLGARLVGEYVMAGGEFQPFAEAHVWRSFGADSHIRFNGDALILDPGRTELALSAGLVARTYSKMDFYGRVNWSRGLDNLRYESFGADAGVRIRW